MVVLRVVPLVPGPPLLPPLLKLVRLLLKRPRLLKVPLPLLRASNPLRYRNAPNP